MNIPLNILKLYLIIPCIALLITISSCKKKKLNESLYEESTESGLVFYKNNDSILSGAGNSPHGSFKLKFNTLAASQFGPDGKLPTGATFQNGSLIVKEIYSGGVITLYVVMKKDDSKFASNGWLWAEYGTDGKTVYSVGEKGESCIGCHSATPNRDLTLSFDLH